MRSQIAGYSMAVKNAQDGISLLQTAEGALGDSNAILQRMRELAVQAANDTLTSQDRIHVDEELQALKGKLDFVAGSTQFNTKKLLDGTSGLMWSSDDSSVRAVVSGSASLLGKPEGSYRLEIHAAPGKAQVQRSNVFDVSTLTKIEQTTDSDTFEVFSEEANTLQDITQLTESPTRLTPQSPPNLAKPLTLTMPESSAPSLTRSSRSSTTTPTP